MLRFLNEVTSFRKCIQQKAKSTRRSKSRTAYSERRHNKTSQTSSSLSQRLVPQTKQSLKEQPSFCNSYRIVEQQSVVVSSKNSKRKRHYKPKPFSQIKNENKQNLQIRIEEDYSGDRSLKPTNLQLVSNSTKVRNEIKATINEAYLRNNDYFQKQVMKERFTKLLTNVYRCIRMLPVINEQCAIGTIGERTYYFLGKIIFRIVSIRHMDLTQQQFLKQGETIFQKASVMDIQNLLSVPQLTELPIRQSMNVSTIAPNMDSYLLREATSLHSSSARKTNTNTSMIKQSQRRQSLYNIDESMRLRTSIHQGRLKRKDGHQFDKQQVLEDQNLLFKLNNKLEEYIARHRLRSRGHLEE